MRLTRDLIYSRVLWLRLYQHSYFVINTYACRSIAVSRWYFEEVATFLELTGPIAFWSIKSDKTVPHRLLEMWEHLHAYALYFLYYTPGQHTLSQIRGAQARLFKFAEFAEEFLNGLLCTLLLHRAQVHIPEQVRDACPGAFMREDFGERSIRSTKHKITHHAAKNAAQASAQCCVLEMSLRQHKLRNPDIDAYRQKIIAARQLRITDDGGTDGVQLHQLKKGYTGEDNDQA